MQKQGKTSRTSYRTNRGFAVPFLAEENCRVNPVAIRPVFRSWLSFSDGVFPIQAPASLISQLNPF
jgi:hypothetical protein